MKRHRKWMSFSLSFGFLSVLCGCRDTPLASLSSMTPTRSEVGPAIIDKVHCNVALKLKSLPPPATLWLLHSDLAESQPAGVGFLLGCRFSAGRVRFPPLPSDHHTPTLCSQSVLLLYERRTSCGTHFDMWVKSCDTGSFLQATHHLQMSASRVTHAGKSSVE